jgi:hypothetical protein
VTLGDAEGKAVHDPLGRRHALALHCAGSTTYSSSTNYSSTDLPMVIVTPSKDDIFPTRHVNAPPPYSPIVGSPAPRSPYPASPSPFRSQRSLFQTLPPNILLQIIHRTIPSSTRHEAYVSTMYWLTHSLRMTSRLLYIACMSFLRNYFLRDYTANVRPGYTTDAFPLEPPEATLPPHLQTHDSIMSLHRETPILDRFIALKCTEEMRSQESELHLDLDHFKDLFDLIQVCPFPAHGKREDFSTNGAPTQPKARLEDLLRKYGARSGVISIVVPDLAPSALSSKLPTPLPFSSITVNLSSRKVGLVVLRRTLAEIRREKDASLESIAKLLVKELARVLGRG